MPPRQFSSRLIRRLTTACVAAIMAIILAPQPVAAQSRIKDIATFEGVRDNLLVGYGLVVGLNGSGDSLGSSPFTQQSLIGMLERLGVNTRDAAADLDTDNVAAVIVTATLPPFQRQGTRIDVTVSTLGDAKSLLGGTLLVTPLLGADGEVYAISQGPVTVSGFAAGGDSGSSVTKGVPTTGRMANGAIIEREVGFSLAGMTSVNISLRNADLSTARRMAQAINGFLGLPAARPLDPATVALQVPARYEGDTVALLTDIEQLRVESDQLARVVIDEQSGVIVMGENVRVNRVAIAQGNLTIRISENPQVSQPNAFSTGGTTVTVPRTTVEVDEDQDARMAVLEPGISLSDLVAGLNALGIGPRDLITILQTIKAAGALQAEIELL
ncbi:MAG: flagellar basal body P-ring protein FlgI [Alphaproteobacteria bacterium]